MKYVLTIAILFFALTTFGQQITSEQWAEEVKTNIRLQPKYGHATKTAAQKRADQRFIEGALKRDSTNRAASDRFISLGFRYLYSDLKTAMYRFNQAYLLDSTNTDIYWGFGAVYMVLGNIEKGKNQYLEGLKINPENTHLLTDYGTYFLVQSQALKPIDEDASLIYLDSAIHYMSKSYEVDPSDQNTTYKLSICYWSKSDCENAWKYYDICKKYGGQPIRENYTEDLRKKCER